MAKLTAFLLAAVAAGQGMLDKPIELLQNMEIKLGELQTADQKTYNEYACWAEKVTAEKTTAITEGLAREQRLTNEAMSNSALAGLREGEVGALKKEIAALEKRMEKQRERRAEGEEKWQAEKKDKGEAVDAVYGAIDVLTNAGKGQGDLLEVADKLHQTLKMRTTPLDSKQIKAVHHFLDRPAAFAFLQNTPGYASQSGTIRGILTQMIDDFTLDLQTGSQQNAADWKLYEEINHTTLDELRTKRTSMKTKTAEMNMAKARAAGATEELAATQEMVKEARKLHEETTLSAQKVTAKFEARKAENAQELAGIQAAIEALEGVKNRLHTNMQAGTTLIQQKPSVSFLQTRLIKQDQRSAAFKVLKEAARKTHSIGLAQLAATVATMSSTKGPFDKVVKAIDNMISVLEEEEKQDNEAKDKAVTFFHDKEMEINDAKDKLAKAVARKNRADEEMAALVAKSTTADGIITENDAAALQAQTIQTGLETETKTAVRELKECVVGINEAIQALTTGTTLVQVDQPKEPSKEMSTKKNTAMESKAVISLLQNIITSINRKIGMLEEEMRDAAGDTLKVVAALHDDSHKQQESIDAMEIQNQDIDLTVLQPAEDVIDQLGGGNEQGPFTSGVIFDLEQQLAEGTPLHQAVLDHFDSRKANRETERNGLMEAKAFLLGMRPPTR